MRLSIICFLLPLKIVYLFCSAILGLGIWCRRLDGNALIVLPSLGFCRSERLVVSLNNCDRDAKLRLYKRNERLEGLSD